LWLFYAKYAGFLTREEPSMDKEDPNKIDPSKEPSTTKGDSQDLPDDSLKAVTGGLQSTPGGMSTGDGCISQL
jgi:hypothetical protein